MLIGIVGKANVGKSTFFKAATLANIEIANYPFTTIKPNHGRGYVKINCIENELNVKCEPKEGYCANSSRFVPVELLDVAGLVPEAHKGKGMGNQFLDDLRQADVLIHIIDAAGATNEKGELVEAGSYNPSNDIKFLEKELDMWYLQILNKTWVNLAKKAHLENTGISRAIAAQFSGLNINEIMVRTLMKKLDLSENGTTWNDADLEKFSSELRRKNKPMLIAANKADLPEGRKNFEKLKREFPDYMIFPCSAESELALKEAAKHGLIDYSPGDNNFEVLDNNKLSDKQRSALEFIKSNVLEKLGNTGVQEILNSAVFDLLGHIAVYPVENEGKFSDSKNKILPDVHLLPKNSTALDLAYKIHSDIGDKFIAAIDAKTKLKLGKEHTLKNKDVVRIVV